MIITINADSFDYDILRSYLNNDFSISKLYIVPQGFFIEVSFEEDIDRRSWIKKLVLLDIDEISFHEILYEEFIPKK